MSDIWIVVFTKTRTMVGRRAYRTYQEARNWADSFNKTYPNKYTVVRYRAIEDHYE